MSACPDDMVMDQLSQAVRLVAISRMSIKHDTSIPVVEHHLKWSAFVQAGFEREVRAILDELAESL